MNRKQPINAVEAASPQATGIRAGMSEVKPEDFAPTGMEETMRNRRLASEAARAGMSETRQRHTPGEWTVTMQPDGLYAVSGRADNAAGTPLLVAVNLSKANVRLIASAPDLLAACRAAVKELDVLQPDIDVGETLAALRAAIALAEGK